MWTAAEPSKGVYNETYLSGLRSITDRLGKAGTMLRT